MPQTEPQSRIHPEQKSGEVFLKNCDRDEPDEFNDIDYQQKRAGLKAFDSDGQVLTTHFPVFVSELEYNVRHKETKIGQ